MDDQISADLEDEVSISQRLLETFGLLETPDINQFICVSLQDGITEEDIDDSFKSMFAQLAGEVKCAR